MSCASTNLTMEQLPTEIVELILANPNLNFEDVVNFGATCSQFHEIVHSSNYVWKKKFEARWPQFVKLFDKEFNEWYAEIRYIYELKKHTHDILSLMSRKFYTIEQFSDRDLQEWKALIKDSPRSYEYIVYDLIEITNCNAQINSIEIVPIDTPGNKTLQYYTIKVLRFIRQVRLGEEWEKFMSLPLNEQILEKGAVFVAQWCQPALEVTWDDISAQLDEYANEVKACLQISNSDHPLLKVPARILQKWKVQNLNGNQWNVYECRQIVQCMTSVLYEQHKFKGNNLEYYTPENSFINKVLLQKEGLPITLAIIYESIARRLGLKCYPINFPAHFLLKFIEGRGEMFADSYYIDVFNCGNMLRKNSCPHSSNERSMVDNSFLATTRQVVERMANNLEMLFRRLTHPHSNITWLRSTLELTHLISPQDISTVVNLARIYMFHGIDTKPLENYLRNQEFQVSEQVQHVVHMLRDYDIHNQHDCCDSILAIEPKTRPSIVKYAVGMVMRHKILNYVCVIYDWDPICTATPEWQYQMEVHKLEKKNEQPFYNVLVEDGSQRYVAQENMQPTADPGLLKLDADLGRYFSHFFETHFVPNAEKEKEFPADALVRHKFYQKLKFGF